MIDGPFFSTFLILLREVLEASLIVGIVVTILERLGRRQYVPHIYLSAFAAAAISLVAGLMLAFAADRAPQSVDTWIEAVASLAGCAVLTYVIFWMARQARYIRGELERQVSAAVTANEYWTLMAIPFVAVIREGVETVLFLFALPAKGSVGSSFAGGMLGALVAILIGAAVIWSGRRFPIRQFFMFTGGLLLFVSAGLLAYGVHEFNELGVVPHVVKEVWNINHIFSDKVGAGSFLKALFGYNGNPSLTEVLAYAGYWLVIVMLLRRNSPVMARQQTGGHMGERVVKVVVALALALTPALAVAQTLNEVVVRGEKEAETLPPVLGTKVYSGKKTSVIDVINDHENVNNNFRQAMQKTPGLLVSEETTPLVSVGYRGLEPHRAQFTQVLRDGIPIHADMFGYPEAYYTPPLSTIDRIEFIRGGGSLLYGPQPGGALNYVTRDPVEDRPLRLTFENTVGSHDLFSSYNELTGTSGRLGYLGYFNHRQSQGFRVNNSQYDLTTGGVKLKLGAGEDTSWELALDSYSEEHGEPGGLTRAAFDADPSQTTRMNDHFELNRQAASLIMEKQIDASRFFDLRLFGGYYERLSWRQRTTGSAFGTVPNGSTNDIESQEFYTAGGEARLRLDYEAFGSDENSLTMGLLYYHVTSPRVEKRGDRPDALDGTLRKDVDRYLNNVALFAENRFKFGRLSVTPGVRLENIWQSIKENVNLDKTTVPLADESEYEFVPLLGLGAAYELTPRTEIYANISQAYRPKIYTQAVPLGAGQTVNNNLEEGKSWQADLGVRGNPLDYVKWDASAFYMEFEDQIGTSGTTVDNVGDSRHQGIELAGEFDLWHWYQKELRGQPKSASFNLFANAMLLDAEFKEGPNIGRTPQYAPDFILKTGVEVAYNDRHRLSLSNTFVDDHYANDTNTDQFTVPSYKVWDLRGEVSLVRDTVSVFAGINNLFDEKYFARVRADGIDPADGRNYYAGLRLVF